MLLSTPNIVCVRVRLGRSGRVQWSKPPKQSAHSCLFSLQAGKGSTGNVPREFIAQQSFRHVTTMKEGGESVAVGFLVVAANFKHFRHKSPSVAFRKRESGVAGRRKGEGCTKFHID